MEEIVVLISFAALGCAAAPPQPAPIPIDGDTPAKAIEPTAADPARICSNAVTFESAASGVSKLFVVPRAKGDYVVMAESGTDIQGRLRPEVIKTVMRASFPRMRACYETLLKVKPEAEELATARFIINESGKVTNVDVATAEPTFRSCIATVVGSIEFPPPEAGKVLVTYPIRYQLTH